MGRVPTPGEIATRYTELVDQALAEPNPNGPRFGVRSLGQHREVRALLVSVTTALHRAHPVVAEALATTLVDLGRQLAPPPPPPEDPRARALRLRLRQNRNTGPTPRTRWRRR